MGTERGDAESRERSGGSGGSARGVNCRVVGWDGWDSGWVVLPFGAAVAVDVGFVQQRQQCLGPPLPTSVAWLNAALGFQSEERTGVMVRKGLGNGRGLVVAAVCVRGDRLRPTLARRDDQTMDPGT
jgi:hypothetical protein